MDEIHGGPGGGVDNGLEAMGWEYSDGWIGMEWDWDGMRWMSL